MLTDAFRPGPGVRTRTEAGAATGTEMSAGRSDPVLREASGCADPGIGTEVATRSPRTSAATTMTATPTPDEVRESSSMASVEKMTVAEP